MQQFIQSKFVLQNFKHIYTIFILLEYNRSYWGQTACRIWSTFRFLLQTPYASTIKQKNCFLQEVERTSLVNIDAGPHYHVMWSVCRPTTMFRSRLITQQNSMPNSKTTDKRYVYLFTVSLYSLLFHTSSFL